MEQILLLLSVLFIGYTIYKVYGSFSYATIVTTFVAYLFVIITLAGFISHYLASHGHTYIVLVISLLGMLSVLKYKIEVVNINKLNNKEVSIVFIVSLVIWLLLSLMNIDFSLLMHGISVDSAAHFALINYIYNNNSLPEGNWSFLWEIAHYPYGFHLTASTISKILGFHPFYIVYAFIIFIAGLIVSSVVIIVFTALNKQSLISYFAVVWAFMFLVLNPYSVDSYMHSGFYPMIAGLFLLIMFFWLLKSVESLTISILLLPWGILSVYGLIYPQWGVVMAMFYIYLILSRPNKSNVHKAALLVLPLLVSFLGTLSFFLENKEGLIYIYNIEGGVLKDSKVVLVLISLVFISIISLFSIQKKDSHIEIKGIVTKVNLDSFVFLGIILLQVVIAIMMKKSTGVGAEYHLYKYLYIIVPILTMTAVILIFSTHCSKYKNTILMILTLVCLVWVFSYNLNWRPHKTPLIMSDDNFQASLWVKEHVVKDKINYLAPAHVALLGYAITGKEELTEKPYWWVYPTALYKEWVENSKSGDIAILPAEWNTDTDLMKIVFDTRVLTLHNQSSTLVLERK